jgi:type IV secretion system protein VirB1
MTALPELLLLLGMCAPSVHPETMLRIVKHESAMNPNAIGVNGGYRLSRQPQTKEQGVAMAEALVKAGFNIDVGYGQINIKTANRMGLSVAQLFEPCTNLNAAARVLTENYVGATQRYGEGQLALNAALSQYNTGNFNAGIANGYVASIRKQPTNFK